MNIFLLRYLCDPYDKSEWTLVDPVYFGDGVVESGKLLSAGGRSFEIREGLPRFIDADLLSASVDSFCD